MKDIRSDRDAQHLADLLRGAVPEAPDPTGRAQQVVRRARRTSRRRGAVGAVAVGAVVAGVIVTPHFIGGSPVSNGATSSHRTVPLAHPFQCPRPDRTPPHMWAPPQDKVPAGAVLVRLCRPRGADQTHWLAPVDALTQQVQAVAETYNALPKGQPLPCPGYPRPTTGFTLTFQYPDDRLVQVAADTDTTGPCDFASITGRNELGRSSAGLVLRAFTEQLLRQRATTAPAPAATHSRTASLACPPRPHFVSSLVQPVDHLDLTQAVVCDYGNFMFPLRNVPTVRLDTALVQAVNVDYAAHLTHDPSKVPGMGCMNPSPPNIEMLGLTKWGDTVVLVYECYSAWGRTLPTTGERVYWVTSPDVDARLAHLFRQ